MLGAKRHGDHHPPLKDIEEMAGMTLGPGTLYGALAVLEQQGMVEALSARDRRRPYRITPAGAEAVRAYLENVRRVAATGLKRLEAYPWPG